MSYTRYVRFVVAVQQLDQTEMAFEYENLKLHIYAPMICNSTLVKTSIVVDPEVVFLRILQLIIILLK